MKSVSSLGPHVEELEKAGIYFTPIEMTRRITPLRDLFALVQLIKYLKQTKPEILHTHTPKANLLGQLAGKLAQVPIRISTVHGFYFTPDTPFIKRLVFQLIEKLSAHFADVVFLINQEDVNTAQKLKICRENQIRFLTGGMGIRLEKFKQTPKSKDFIYEKRAELGIPPDALVVGFVGRLVAEKGLYELFSAFQELYSEFPHMYLLLVGPYDEEKADSISPTSLSAYPYHNRVIFTGIRSDVNDLYKLMDIFTLPSYREGMPLCVMEAQAVGLPIITTAVRGCREAIIDGETGILVPVRSSNALANAIRALANNTTLRKQMGAAGQRLASQKFDQNLAFISIENEYQEQIKSKIKEKG